MKKLLFVGSLFFMSIILLGCSHATEKQDTQAFSPNTETQSEVTKEGLTMKISIQNQEKTLQFELNDSPAAKAFYEQLPLTIEIKNFSDNEKIFYPPQKLTTENTPVAYAEKGTLAYFAPWGNMTIFYKDYGQGTDLYEIGHVVSGKENIANLTGTATIQKVDINQ